MTDSRSELPDREMVARVVAEQLGECWERLVDEHLNPSFCKEDFRRCADAILFLLVGGDQKKLTADGQHQTEQSGKQLSPTWQPIETAPKDGQIILLGSVGSEPRPAYWGLAFRSYGAGADAKFPWTFLDNTNGVNHLSDDATGASHWMPLPAPPPVAETDAVAPGDAGGAE